ncbi:MAG: hypothetical protein PHY47_15600 [Lachnospiraceae bacterium]|nr:hypothetical protein [Lachnospiraceae bacterium]
MEKNEKRTSKKSPLISSSSAAQLFPQNGVTLLVCCCNERGGLFLVNFTNEEYSYKQVLTGECRGIAKYGDNYIVASNDYGVFLLDREFKIVKRHIPQQMMDYHGVKIYKDRAYIVETACIFRENCASVPKERIAIPLETERSSAS